MPWITNPMRSPSYNFSTRNAMSTSSQESWACRRSTSRCLLASFLILSQKFKNKLPTKKKVEPKFEMVMFWLWSLTEISRENKMPSNSLINMSKIIQDLEDSSNGLENSGASSATDTPDQPSSNLYPQTCKYKTLAFIPN